MKPTDADAARIPPRNLGVPREAFVAVWREAVGRAEAADPGDVDGYVDGYVDAVVHTCRWMAALPMRTALCGGQARSPVTLRGWPARPDLIEAEWAAAQRPDAFTPDLAARPGWCDGVRATLAWAWCGDGPPPLAVPTQLLAGIDRQARDTSQ
ncbi:hypothetical protein Acsp06_60140 [Actinomycetospora sp. NBRC 106375]|uniref:hypothetical protein n=1 Tax=Actinomycetospora sp. NBRC 106375 TaxID=3032207 RepID=UPI0024A3A9E9|nr:hypothetical protein [Actinomycetospora sp. NBRC 106375]GLZ49829.1 hypothetical protein Acsp06_60140 [Actinomycetospora sp. NBRC 106375]